MTDITITLVMTRTLTAPIDVCVCCAIRSSILGMGLVETTTTVMKRAELQEVGASTEEGERGRSGREDGGSGGVLQVCTDGRARGRQTTQAHAREIRAGKVRRCRVRSKYFGIWVDKKTKLHTNHSKPPVQCQIIAQNKQSTTIF